MAKTMDFPLTGDAMTRQETAIISRRAIQTRQAPLLESRISSLEDKLDQVLELLIQQTQKQGELQLDLLGFVAMIGHLSKLLNLMMQITGTLFFLILFIAALLQAGRSLSTEEAPDRDKLTTKITAIHIKARSTPYPNSIIQRARVLDAYVPWEVLELFYYCLLVSASKCFISHFANEQ